MRELTTKVTYVKKYFLGLPVKTLHKYRESYFGKVKDCDDCTLFISPKSLFTYLKIIV